MVGWKDGRTKGGRTIFIFVFLGVRSIKHGVVSNIHLEHLGHKIKNWRPLARLLLFEDAEIAAIDQENQEISAKALAMLERCKQREGSATSYQVLYDALSHALVDRRDLAVEICIDANSFLVST